MNRDLPLRPTQHARRKLVGWILDGTCGPGATLPAERILAGELGVTRPTLRETLQGLQKEGWLTIQHGKPTVVNDYWKTGGLTLLATLTEFSAALPREFIGHLLSVRVAIVPMMASLAVERAPGPIRAHLARLDELEDSAQGYAAFDWELQVRMAQGSGNPFYTLLLNDFGVVYHSMGQGYFEKKQARERSRRFFLDLRRALLRGGRASVERLVRKAMEESLAAWQEGK